MILHTGSMFSGKTSSLERDLKRFAIANYKTIAFKPKIDSRYSKTEIVSHDLNKYTAILVNDSKEIYDYVIDNNTQVIGIDEIQFLKDRPEELIKNLGKILSLGITIVIAGLDMDYLAKPFELVKELMPIADYVNKHHAVCKKCGADAWVSHRKVKGQSRLVLGAEEEYEPLCRTCYIKALEEDKINLNQEKFL